MQKELYDLTNTQKSIWYTEEVFKGTTIENILGTAVISEKVDFDVLEKSINLFVQKNDAFRLKFILEKGNVKQFVSEFTSFNVDKIFLSDESKLKSLEKKLLRVPFNTLNSLLFDFKMFEFPDGHGGFIANMHHLISDAWTSGILVSEIINLYTALLKNKAISDENPPSYIDYIISEKEYLNSKKFKNDEKFWNDTFASVPEVATIPSLNNDTNTFSCNAKRKQFVIPKSTMDLINEFCINNKVSAFNFFMGILAIYLGRVSNLDEFVIGTPVLNRSNFKEKHTVGMFISVVPFKITINHDKKFTEFLAQISADFFNIFRHQKYPYQCLLDNLRKQDNSIPHLYNILMSYQNMRSNKQSAEVQYEARWSFNNNISDDMEIHFFDINDTGDINIAYDYKTAKYSKEDIFELHSRIINIINQVLTNKEILLKEIEIVSPDEKNKLIYEFNNTKVDYEKNKTISQLFEEQVEKTPDNIAVVFEEQNLTYKELNKKANSLANYLRDNGIGRNDIIGIMTSRSLEMIISILAVLKAGATYIPIDPTYPKDRIEYMLSNSNAKFVLTQEKIKNSINFKNIILVDLNSNVYNLDRNNLKNINEPTDSSYIIYTSGSTGLPKGATLTHLALSNLTNYCNNYIEYLKHNSYRAVVSITTVSFDIFIFETLISLQKGLKLIIANENEQTIPRLLNDLIKKHNVQIIQATPSRMQLLVNNLQDIPELKNLKFITLAGEQLPLHLVQTLHKLSGATVYNGYGPSETTVFSTLTEMDGNFITIGKPLYNTQIYILDKNLSPVPIGIAGELYIAGDGVGKGYLNNNSLTAKSFIPNPFIENTIMYKTGDLGRYTNDGKIICLGRCDNQVKIRGLRIELGEIEKRILENSNITNCVVVKKVDKSSSHESLCAYFTSKTAIDEKLLRTNLQKILPNYMIPQYFCKLKELPYTPNGKVDIKKLPMPKIEAHHKNIILPKNTTQTKLIDLLKNLLNINDISMDDNFFELGGDSLSAINLCTQIHSEFNIQIFVKDILEHPTISQISDIIDTLNPTTSFAIVPAPKMNSYPVSSAQKRMYLSSTISGENSILYNISGGVILDKLPDIEKLENCFNTLINRHEALRTYFVLENDTVVQKIQDTTNFKLVVDKSLISVDNLKTAYDEFVKPFDLSFAPLFRAKLTYMENDAALLLVDMHHIISDGTSLSIFIDELCKLYNDETLPDLSITYKDFACFENKQISSGNLKESENFWVNQFENDIPVLNLPTIYARPSVKSYDGNKIYSKLDKKTTEKINNICKELGLTPYMILLSIYYILLSKYTSQETIVVGSPIVGRNMTELYNLIGMFVNSLPMKAKIDANLSFKDFANTVKTMCLENYKHQDYPFDELVNKLNIPKDTSRNPLFDTMFIYQNNGNPTINLGKINSKYYIPDTKISKFDLSLEIIPDNHTLNLSFEYCTKLFDKHFIQNLSNHYSNILNIVLENLDIKLCDIDMLSEDEKNKILYEFNNTKTDYPKDKTIIEIFEEQVEKVPNNIAVVFENQKLTYKELNEKANSLANYLRNNGLQEHSIVGIHLEKNIDYIISILATLKAGSTFLPISTLHPKARIEYILKNSHTSWLISKNNLINNLDFNCKYLDIQNYEFDNYNTNLNIKYSSEDIAYILYTSGSTGNPKGVKIKNYSLINHVFAINYRFGNSICNNDVCLSIANISFDASIQEIFIPLLLGASLHLLSDNSIYNIKYLSEYIYKNDITFTFIPPNILDDVYSFLKEKDNIKLNKLLVGVEKIKYSTLNNFLDLNKKMQIHNGYGPTEATICCISYMYNNDNKIISNDFVPIGKPLINNEIIIVEPNTKQIQPLYVPGEIHILGDQVADGYIDTDLNTKFYNCPYFNKIAYCSGDFAYYDNYGNINFIGRKDNQIKLNGHRIELFEIDMAVQSFEDISRSITLLKGNKLITFFISSEKIDCTKLKEFIKNKIPIYMVPNKFIQLDKIPMTDNGKINTNALLNMNLDDENHEIILPSNQTEQVIFDIFSNLLNIKNFSTLDNFFDLGGDSLSAIKLSIEINNILSKEISVQDIFTNSSVKNLADYISTQSTNSNIAIPVAKKLNTYPLSSAQKRMYLSSNIAGTNSILYNIPGGVILDKLPDIKRLENCFNVLINRHEALRTYFVLENDTVVQKIQDTTNFKLVVDKNPISVDNLKLAYDEFVKPFDLSTSPLFRAKLIYLENGKALLLVDMHHIISDGTSLSIFIDELCKLYNDETLPTLSHTYKDFACFENEQISSGKLKKAEDFWVNQFENDIPVLNMPTSYSRPAIQSFEGKKLYADLNLHIKEKIDNLAKSLGTTPYMVMLSAYYILLAKYTGQETIVVGSPIVGRDFADTYNIIGMFVNTIALKNKVDLNNSFKELLNNVKQNCLNAYKYQTYPFDELVNKLNIKRNTSRNPLFDTMFTYQNNGTPSLHLGDISARHYIPDSNISKFDFSLEVIPNENGFHINFEYCTKLFNDDFMTNMLNHFINILNIVLDNSDIKISDIDMLSKDERNKLLSEFNNTKTNYPKDKTIVKLFEEQVEKSQNEIAIIYKNEKLTYSELNKKVNSLANFLKANGVEKNDIIPVLLDRSDKLIISMLAIIKAGAAYLPISTEYPLDRINYIISNSNAKVVITDHSNTLINNDLLHIIFIDDYDFSRYSHKNLDLDISVNDLLYVIYTSGSTGNPKGVKISHNNLANFIYSFTDYFENISSKDKCLATTNISFDVSIWEFFISLLNGGLLYLYEENTINDIFKYCKCIIDNKISLLYIPPNILEEVYNILSNYDNVPIKKLLLGVEPIKSSIIKKYYKFNKNMKIVNAYGPTETTICATANILNPETISNYQIIPIGKPLCNLDVFVLDKALNLVPVGVPGELYISGSGVGKGYLNNKELTSKSFIELPKFNCKKAYKTGDLVKWNSDGNISFIGREDFQIKINGHRIELGEIEACICQYPNIDKAVILIDKSKKIIAYFSSTKEINLNDLKAFMQRKLPNYFIPNFFVQLDAFKLTPNGKIDRKALSKIKIDTSSNYEPPHTDYEKKLSNLFGKVLGLEKIGITDNFFDIGGDSLSAIKLQIEAFNEGIDLAYKDIFKYPTIKQLSEHIQSNNSEEVVTESNYDYTEINGLIRENTSSNKVNIIRKEKLKNVLLTGATGFMGSHILDNLMKNTRSTVYCLIRAKDNTDPQTRLLDVLRFYFGNKYDKLIFKRIFVIEGDITDSKLGLTNYYYEWLGQNINCVINSAAIVKHYGNSEIFNDTNVVGTQNIINFCNKFSCKLLHISTTSVSGNIFETNEYKVAELEKGTVFAENSFYIGQDLSNIYIHTKFIAERLVLESIIQNNLNAKIIRIGNITNRYSDGAFQLNVTENAFLNRINSFLQIGCIPDYLLDGYLEFTPADLCADAIVKLALYKSPFTIFHVYNNNHITLKEMVKIFNHLGLSIDVVDTNTFNEKIKTLSKDETSKNALSGIINDFDENKKLVYNTNIKIKNDFTNNYLKKIYFKWPKIGEKYLNKYIIYLKSIGYIK